MLNIQDTCVVNKMIISGISLKKKGFIKHLTLSTIYVCIVYTLNNKYKKDGLRSMNHYCLTTNGLSSAFLVCYIITWFAKQMTNISYIY